MPTPLPGGRRPETHCNSAAGGPRSVQRYKSEMKCPRILRSGSIASRMAIGLGRNRTSAPNSHWAVLWIRSRQCFPEADDSARDMPARAIELVGPPGEKRLPASFWTRRSTLTKGDKRLTSRKTSSRRSAASVREQRVQCRTAPDSSVIEIDPFLLEDQRPVHYLGVNKADVFAEDADEEQLYGRNEEDADHQRRDADLETVPKDELVNEIAQGHQQAEADMANPSIVARRKGTFEWLVMPSMAMSYSV